MSCAAGNAHRTPCWMPVCALILGVPATTRGASAAVRRLDAWAYPSTEPVCYVLGMPGSYDATTKYLVETYPQDWLAYVGFSPVGRVSVLDADLSTVTAAVDKVLRIEDPEPAIVHLEFQTTYDRAIGRRLNRYNGMLHHDEEVPVFSVLVLLRPSADGPAASGLHQMSLPGRPPHLHFEYGVRRVWEEPVSDLLAGPLGTLPMAPLGAADLPALPSVLRTMEQRFTREIAPGEADQLRVVTYTLLGLRFPPTVVDRMMPGIRSMRDSLTYQAILEEGRVEGRAEGRVDEARELLLELGTGRFGPPDGGTHATLRAIADRAQLHALAARLLTVASWHELLAGRDRPDEQLATP